MSHSSSIFSMASGRQGHKIAKKAIFTISIKIYIKHVKSSIFKIIIVRERILFSTVYVRKNKLQLGAC